MAAAVPGAEVTWSGQHAVVIAPALRVHLFCALADRPRLCGLAYARAVLGEFAAGRDGSGIFRAWGSGSQSLYERTLTGLLDPSAPAARPLELALVEAVETHVGQPLRHPENFHDRFFDDLAGLVAAARLACPEDPLTPAVVVGGPDCPACCGEEAMWRVVRSDRGHAAQAGMAGGLRSGGSVLGSEEAAEPALASWCPAHVTLVPSPSDLPLKWSLCRRDRVGDWGQPGRWHWLDRRGPALVEDGRALPRRPAPMRHAVLCRPGPLGGAV